MLFLSRMHSCRLLFIFRALCLQFRLPESPRWLLLNGAGKEAATQALIKAEGKRADNRAVVEAEVAAISAGIAESTSSSGSSSVSVLDLFKEERYRRPTLVGMSLMLFQQVGWHSGMCNMCWMYVLPLI